MNEQKIKKKTKKNSEHNESTYYKLNMDPIDVVIGYKMTISINLLHFRTISFKKTLQIKYESLLFLSNASHS